MLIQLSQTPRPAKSEAPSKHEIRPDQSVELLKALHILTRDGKLNQDSRRKLKQVNHLVQFIEPLLDDILARPDAQGVTLVDHGAGKSYLGFMLYDACLKKLDAQTLAQSCICGIETRAELVERSQALAHTCGFAQMQFFNLSVAESILSLQLPQRIDIVTALHACNTATDDAIRFALAKQVRHIVLVPCCQAEVAAELRRTKAQTLARPLAEVWRHPLHTREFGSHLTNVLRCLQLEAHGYRVNVTELVGWEHSLKNELIIASRHGTPKRAAARRLQALLEDMGLQGLSGRFFLPENSKNAEIGCSARNGTEVTGTFLADNSKSQS